MQPKPQKDRTLLTMNVNFLLGRYHGSEWPPSLREDSFWHLYPHCIREADGALISLLASDP